MKVVNFIDLNGRLFLQERSPQEMDAACSVEAVELVSEEATQNKGATTIKEKQKKKKKSATKIKAATVGLNVQASPCEKAED